MKKQEITKRCSSCDAERVPLHACEGGFICDSCLETGRRGKDVTTKATRLITSADQLLKDKVLLEPALGNTVATTRRALADNLPALAAVDAEAQRLDLLDKLGTDCVALGIDAARSIEAKDSLEIMLSHQLAVAHKTTLEVTSKGMLESDPVERARTLNVAARFMDVFQRGLLTLQRLRTGGAQSITVHYANVEEGGQAVVGNVATGGRRK